MRESFIKLHIAILLAGFTGLFGKLIDLNEGILVWYRMLISTFLFILISIHKKNINSVKFLGVLQLAFAGFLIALHWVCFYASIKFSNVSIGVTCFAMTGFFTAILEPLINKKKVSLLEILFSTLTIVGIGLIFHFDARHRIGILYGIIAAILAALFGIINKKMTTQYDPSTILTYEMGGGMIALTCILPFYLSHAPTLSFFPSFNEWILLFILSGLCTVWAFILQLQAMRKISAFTVSLSYNLEPLYSIAFAMIIFNENKELNFSFYLGLILITLSISLQMFYIIRKQRKHNVTFY